MNFFQIIKKYSISLARSIKKALRYSESQCYKRFGGKVGVNMHYSTKSSFTSFDKSITVLKKIIKKRYS